jgi:hypothetical protein
MFIVYIIRVSDVLAASIITSLIMEVLSTTETSIGLYETAGCKIPEDSSNIRKTEAFTASVTWSVHLNWSFVVLETFEGQGCVTRWSIRGQAPGGDMALLVDQPWVRWHSCSFNTGDYGFEYALSR